MELSLTTISIAGFIIGTILSIVLGVYSKATATHYTRDLFGMSSTKFIKAITLFLGTFVTAIYIIFAVLIRDIEYPNAHPWAFTAEVILAAAIPASFIFVLHKLRGNMFTKLVYIEFFVLLVKFGIGHVLLQFSGLYSSLFGEGTH
jgi:hypothetical protein